MEPRHFLQAAELDRATARHERKTNEHAHYDPFHCFFSGRLQDDDLGREKRDFTFSNARSDGDQLVPIDNPGFQSSDLDVLVDLPSSGDRPPE